MWNKWLNKEGKVSSSGEWKAEKFPTMETPLVDNRPFPEHLLANSFRFRIVATVIITIIKVPAGALAWGQLHRMNAWGALSLRKRWQSRLCWADEMSPCMRAEGRSGSCFLVMASTSGSNSFLSFWSPTSWRSIDPYNKANGNAFCFGSLFIWLFIVVFFFCSGLKTLENYGVKVKCLHVILSEKKELMQASSIHELRLWPKS